MTVAHDSFFIHPQHTSSVTTTPNPIVVACTPSRPPKGVVVMIAAAAAETIDSVTYGGVALAHVETANDTSGETGGSRVYFLGTGIPTGPQNVEVAYTGTGAKRVYVAIVKGSSDTEVVDSGVVQEDAADPQVALDSGAVVAMRYANLFSGQGTLSNVTPVAGATELLEFLIGSTMRALVRQTNASSGSFSIGWTAGSDDVAMVALAIAENGDNPDPEASQLINAYGLTHVNILT